MTSVPTAEGSSSAGREERPGTPALLLLPRPNKLSALVGHSRKKRPRPFHDLGGEPGAHSVTVRFRVDFRYQLAELAVDFSKRLAALLLDVNVIAKGDPQRVE